jgi:predicted kinase
MIPRLVHLNGPPGIGKTTIARRYVSDHALAFCLDIDGIRCLIGRWDDNEEESGHLARLMAMEMVRTHLSEGHDVIIPQYVARHEFVRQLASIADGCGATFHEVVLWADEDEAEARFDSRSNGQDPVGHHRDAARMISRAGGFGSTYGQLRELLPVLTDAVVMPTMRGDVEDTYRALLTTLDADVSKQTGT